MNLPNLPTDNLYKFLALSGLAIFALSILFPLKRMSETNLKILEVDTQVHILEIESDYIRKNIIDALVSKGNLTPKEKETFRKYVKDILEKGEPWKEKEEEGEPILSIKEQAVFRSAGEQIMKKAAKLKGLLRETDYLIEELKTYFLVISVGGICGFLISVYGFVCWYYLIQKPNDMLLKKQIENNKK